MVTKPIIENGDPHQRRLIITGYVIIDDLMRSLNHRSHCLAKVTDAEVLTVAVVAARYFHNNHERAL